MMDEQLRRDLERLTRFEVTETVLPRYATHEATPGYGDVREIAGIALAALAEAQIDVGLADARADAVESEKAALVEVLGIASEIIDQNPSEDTCRHGAYVHECEGEDGEPCIDRSRREQISGTLADLSPAAAARDERIKSQAVADFLANSTPHHCPDSSALIAKGVEQEREMLYEAVDAMPPNVARRKRSILALLSSEAPPCSQCALRHPANEPCGGPWNDGAAGYGPDACPNCYGAGRPVCSEPPPDGGFAPKDGAK